MGWARNRPSVALAVAAASPVSRSRSLIVRFVVSDDGEHARFDQVNVDVYHSRQGDSGLEQFEGSALNDASGAWFFLDRETMEQTELADLPYVREGDRITGSLAGLQQTWPDEGAATVDVTFDLDVAGEANEEC